MFQAKIVMWNLPTSIVSIPPIWAIAQMVHEYSNPQRLQTFSNFFSVVDVDGPPELSIF